MEREEIKESRVLMRRVEDHLRHAHYALGAVEETTGFVDVIHHENSPLPLLNYVTPRRNTAWVSGKYVMQGLDLLHQKEREARVRFAEGLYPPIFVRALTEIGLSVHHETPIMAVHLRQESVEAPVLPDELSIVQAEAHSSMAIWWYAWQSGWYEMQINSVQPLLIEREVTRMNTDNQINLIIYHNQYPIALSRVSLNAGSAHLMAQAVLREKQTHELEQLLRQVSIDAALSMGCDLVFACADRSEQRSAYRELGFNDASSIVTYAKAAADAAHDNKLEQSVLVL